MNTKTLKAKLDKVFSLFIRTRDSKEFNFEYFKCISCGEIKPYAQADCSHYYGRTILATRFDEKNCNSGCRKCNRFMEGNRQGYAQGLIRKYGEGILDLLEIKSFTTCKYGHFEYEQLIKHYRAMTEALKR